MQADVHPHVRINLFGGVENESLTRCDCETEGSRCARAAVWSVSGAPGQIEREKERECVLFIGTPSVTLALGAFTATTVLR